MKKHFVFKSETWTLIYISAENLSIKDFGCLGELIYLQNWEIGASIWGTFPPLAFSFCTWVGGTGLWDWPVARYMAWTHRIRSCSSSLAKITVSPSFTALKNVLPPSKPGRKGSDNAVSQILMPAGRSPLVSHPTTAPVSLRPVPCCSQPRPHPCTKLTCNIAHRSPGNPITKTCPNTLRLIAPHLQLHLCKSHVGTTGDQLKMGFEWEAPH